MKAKELCYLVQTEEWLIILAALPFKYYFTKFSSKRQVEQWFSKCLDLFAAVIYKPNPKD